MKVQISRDEDPNLIFMKETDAVIFEFIDFDRELHGSRFITTPEKLFEILKAAHKVEPLKTF